MEPTTAHINRPIFLTREGATLKLNFSWNERIVDMVRGLPYALYDGETRSWNIDFTRQAVEALRQWYQAEGLTDIYVDDLLLTPDEILPEAPIALLRPGSLKRPYIVRIGIRDEQLFTRFRSIPGAQWEKLIGGLSYPATSAAALGELVTRGILTDPQSLLQPSELTITFDGRVGKFVVRGDKRAQRAFDQHFPSRDVVSEWTAKGFDVGFSDTFTEEVYRGELSRKQKVLQPAGLLEPLFEYQARSVAVAVERGGFAIWDQPGLGKTATAIGYGWELLENRKETTRIVIVVPGAIKTQFAREITRFTGDEVVVIDGDKKKRTKLYVEAKQARWVVLNYDLLHIDLKLITPLVVGSVLIADEAHRLKTRTSKRAQAMRTLALKASRRLALSGTPIENNPGEWYTLMNNFVVPGVFGGAIEFFNRYSYPGRFGGYEGARNLGELRDRSKPHYIRHIKSEVAAFLPPLLVKNLVLDPDEKLAAALKQAHRDAEKEIAEAALSKRTPETLDEDTEDEIETGAAMTAVGMLRLLCSSPRLIWNSKAPAAVALCDAGLIPEIDGPKLDELRLLAAEMQGAGERLVVFTGFRSMAALIAERFQEDGIRYVLFTGGTSTKDRDKAVQAFTTAGTEETPGPTIFLATDAASEGLNLGKCCSTLVNFDLSYKPSTLTQRANRIHRVDGDTTKRYLVINLTLSRTIEEGILRLVGSKADLSDAILGEKGSRRNATGRGGRNMFEQAIQEWGR